MPFSRSLPPRHSQARLRARGRSRRTAILLAAFLGSLVFRAANARCQEVRCKPPPKATELEYRTWMSICETGEARLSETDTISSTFLETIASKEPYASEIKHRGLSLIGGSVDGRVMLSHVTFEAPLLRLSTVFHNLVDISDSHFSGEVSFEGATLRQGIKAARTVINGSLLIGQTGDEHYFGYRFAGGAAIQFVRAPHLLVNGDMVIGGASVGSFDTASDAPLGDDTWQIQHAGMHPLPTLDAGLVDISNATIRGSLTLMYVRAAYVDLSASDVGNQLILYNCVILPLARSTPGRDGTLNLYSLRSQQSALVNRDTIQQVFMEDADIKGDLILLGTTLSTLNARSANVSGALGLGVHPDIPASQTRWIGESMLDLTMAHFGSIRAPESLSFWPRNIRFYGFTFQLYSPDFCNSMGCTHSERWFQDWLGLQGDDRKSFEPYKGVIGMLDAEGNFADAQNLGVRGRDVELWEAYGQGQYPKFLALVFYRFAVGYGYKIYWSVYWAIFFVLMGAVIFRNTEVARQNGMPVGLAYSFDMLLPLVRLREEHYHIELPGWPRYYFYVHKLLGWALGLMIVAAVTGVAK